MTPLRHLIVADDSAAVRGLVRQSLRDFFLDVIELSNGRDLFWTIAALLRARDEGGPDVTVIADVVMPVYSGIDVLEAWSGNDGPARSVAMTAFPDGTLRSRVRRSGAVLLEKPFTHHALVRAVEALDPRACGLRSHAIHAHGER